MIPESIKLYWQTLGSEAYNRSVIAVELLIIGTVVYTVLRFLHGTRGARLLKGLIFLAIVVFLAVKVLAERFEWDRIRVLYQTFAWFAALTVLIVFQQELRRGLTRLGEARWLRRWKADVDPIVVPIANAAASLSKRKIGAIIAIEREVPLGAWADNGVRLDARLSADLLNTIFWPNSALHDMGVVVQQDRLAAAGVQFPLAETGTVDRQLGSRHRAAVGLSTESDALVVIVSEETGMISIADRGRLIRGVAPDELPRTLRDRLLRRRRRRRRRRRIRPVTKGIGASSRGDDRDETSGEGAERRPEVVAGVDGRPKPPEVTRGQGDDEASSASTQQEKTEVLK